MIGMAACSYHQLQRRPYGLESIRYVRYRSSCSITHMRKATKKKLAKYWGYLLLIALVLGWFYRQLDPAVLGILSGLVIIYCLFQAPVPCCAKTREDEFCRNNASGLLSGCHLKQHKWQNIKMLVQQHAWAEFARGTFRRIGGHAAALSVLIAMAGVIVSIVTPLLN